MRFVYVIPIGSFLLGLFVVGSIGTLGDRPPDPEEINLNTELDYSRMAEGYAAQGKKKEALAICTAMESEYSQTAVDLCALEVHETFDDIDSTIAIYERWLIEERAAGDSGALTESRLESLREQRDQKR
ncbi:MAG: hypothetical protein HC800_24990 [Phormidesmis sp. RL_2_1]|nr:hypothetical protein [Phormidesmis sp. RL_2_1]